MKIKISLRTCEDFCPDLVLISTDFVCDFSLIFPMLLELHQVLLRENVNSFVASAGICIESLKLAAEPLKLV